MRKYLPGAPGAAGDVRGGVPGGGSLIVKKHIRKKSQDAADASWDFSSIIIAYDAPQVL